MSRVRSLPTWMLRMILRLPTSRGMWTDAWLEIWKREVADVVQAEADDEGCSQPGVCQQMSQVGPRDVVSQPPQQNRFAIFRG